MGNITTTEESIAGAPTVACPSFDEMTAAPATAAREFWREINRMEAEARGAAAEARTAMERLAKVCQSRDTSGAIVVRDILYSAFSGGATRCDLGRLGTLDWSVRKDVLAVLLAVNMPGFPDEEIRWAIWREGREALDGWFCERFEQEKKLCRRALKS